MLEPRKVKHRKQHRGRMAGVSKGANELAFGEYGIQALEPGWITARQIEASRIAMTRHIKRGGKVWQRKPRVVGRRCQAGSSVVRVVLPNCSNCASGFEPCCAEVAD